MESIEFNTSLLSFKIDEIFSKLVKPKREDSEFREDSISDYSSDFIYDFLSNFTETIYGDFGSETIYFQWIFNKERSLQENFGDISVLLTWQEKSKTILGAAALEAKVTLRNNDIVPRSLDSKEIEKVSKYSKSKVPVKYLVYSAEKFQDITFNDQVLAVRAKCVPIDKLKMVNFSLNPSHYINRSELCFSVGEQIVDRYLNKLDVSLYPVDPDSPDSKNVKNKLLEKFKEINYSKNGSVLLISKNTTNIISATDFGLNRFAVLSLTLLPKSASNNNTRYAEF